MNAHKETQMITYCSKLEVELIALTASLQLSSCMYRMAAMMRRVLLLLAVLSLSHSFTCRIAISLVEGLSKKVARSFIASRPVGGTIT